MWFVRAMEMLVEVTKQWNNWKYLLRFPVDKKIVYPIIIRKHKKKWTKNDIPPTRTKGQRYLWIFLWVLFFRLLNQPCKKFKKFTFGNLHHHHPKCLSFLLNIKRISLLFLLVSEMWIIRRWRHVWCEYVAIRRQMQKVTSP